ncbi:MAG: helix-turn-helix domain-containing protein, partial [Phycisphaerales bacterium]
RAAVLSRNLTIGIHDLPPMVTDADARPLAIGRQTDPDAPWVPMPLADAMMEPERRIILKALDANDWNRQQTAEVLGINRTTLYKKMKQLGIDPEDHAQAG